ncbi:MAG: response regulator, partial [bacterium]
NTPDALLGDPARLSQILVNLVGNSTKFTDKGEVVLQVEPERETGNEAVLHFSVADTGIGIPEEKLATIFDAFTQADGSRSRKHEGTGLGLTISSSLVKLMGGRMWVESEEGKGSVFHFSVGFRLATQVRTDIPVCDTESVGGTRLLIVDDNQTTRDILEEMACNWGMRPTAVPNAAEAMDALRDAAETKEPYRLVVSDVGMPEIDGFALVKWIKEIPSLAGTPIILLTSGARPDDVKRCEQLRVSTHLMKPVKESEFLNAVGMSLGITIPEKARNEMRGSEWETKLSPLRVLLAEDSVVNQKLAIGILEKFGHSVTVASNGEEAVKALDSQQFDVVLMDVEMPGMDGLEATSRIREKEKQTNTHIPIIAMTAHAMKGDRQRCLDAGMDDYVSKPIRIKQLLKTLESVLNDRGTTTSLPESEL